MILKGLRPYAADPPLPPKGLHRASIGPKNIKKSGSELTGKILRFGRFSLGTYFFEIGISFLILFPEI